MSAPCQFILTKVAQSLGVAPDVVEEAAVVYEDVILAFQQKGAAPCLVWCFEVRKEREAPGARDPRDARESEAGGTSPSHASSAGVSVEDADDNRSMASSQRTFQRGLGGATGTLVVSNTPAAMPLLFPCCVFIRTHPEAAVAITDANVEAEVTCTVLAGDFLGAVALRLQHVYLPLLQGRQDWGVLTQQQTDARFPTGGCPVARRPPEVADFLEACDTALRVLTEADRSLAHTVRLAKPARRFDIDANARAFTKAAARKEVVQAFRDVVLEWMGQVQDILAAGLRRADPQEAVGPHLELLRWKMQLAQFESLTEELRGKSCRVVFGVLTAAGDPVLERWAAVEGRLLEAATEARDNVRYLATLERAVAPILHADPVQMEPLIPGLLNAIRMAHSLSRFYNTSDKVTLLLTQLNVGIIQRCIQYLDRGGPLLDQPCEDAIQKLKACLHLYDTYRAQYRKTKEDLVANLHGKHFEFGEQLIFGKFEAFCDRLAKVLEVVRVMEEFDTLARFSIEGIAPLCLRAQQAVHNVRRKWGTRFLDAERSVGFDGGLAEFRSAAAALGAELAAFINASFLSVTNAHPALVLWARFKAAMRGPGTAELLQEKLLGILHAYGRDLQAVRAMYEKWKADPPVPRNTPPVAGAIAWARQLLRHVEAPMQRFQAIPDILHTKDGKAAVRAYNQIAQALVLYEGLWYERWKESIAVGRAGLTATLLVQDPADSRLHVNFDPAILRLAREVGCLHRMGFAIPSPAVAVFNKSAALRRQYDSLRELLRSYYAVLGEVSPEYANVLLPRVDRLNCRMNAGVQQFTWSSVGVQQYITEVQAEVTTLQTVVTRLNEMLHRRIEDSLRAITRQAFAVLRMEEGTFPSLPDLLERQRLWAEATAKHIDICSHEVEVATHDIISILTEGYSDQELTRVTSHVEGFVLMQEHRVFTTILANLEGSVEYLRACVAGESNARRKQPPFRTEVILRLPALELLPSLEELQRSVNRCARIILESTQAVYSWRPFDLSIRPTAEADASRNLYLRLSKHRPITQVFLSLPGAVSSLNDEVSAFLRTFDHFAGLLRESVDPKGLGIGVSTSSLLPPPGAVGEPALEVEHLEAQVERYFALEKQVAEMEATHTIGCLLIDLSKVKAALKHEAMTRKNACAHRLSQRGRKALEQLSVKITSLAAKLRGKVHDLSDVNAKMELLAQIRRDEGEMELQQLRPILATYDFLAHHDVRVPQEEQDMADALATKWATLVRLAHTTAEELRRISPVFRGALVQNVRRFIATVRDFKADYDRHGPMVQDIEPREAIERLKKFQKQYAEYERRTKDYAMGEDLFGLTKTPYPELQQIDRELKLLSKLYDLYTEAVARVGQCEEVRWAEMDREGLEAALKDLSGRCRRLPKALRDWPAYLELREMVEDLETALPIMGALRDRSVRERHWQSVSAVCGVALNPADPHLRLKALMEARLPQRQEEVGEILNAAAKEAEIEAKLQRIKEDWAVREVVLGGFKGRGLVLLKPDCTSSLLADLEEGQLQLTALLSNRHNAAFRRELQQWAATLATVQGRLEEWLAVQHLWMYMEAVFAGAGDIGRELPGEVKRFANIDRQWTKIMRMAADGPNVVRLCCHDETLANVLPHLRAYLELCQKSLSGYLEAKRVAMPRFYFVSDSQLLEILGQGSDPLSVQPHLLSVSANIAEATFEGGGALIVAVQSSEGELLLLSRPVAVGAEVIDWLSRLLAETRHTLRDLMRCMVADLPRTFLDITAAEVRMFVERYPAQIALVGLQMFWTHDSEVALNHIRSEKGIMVTTYKRFKLLLELLVGMTRADLDRQRRTKLETLIIVHIHQLDVFAALLKVQKRLRNALDFDWLKQTRFYWRAEQDGCYLQITDVQFEYCFEYLGCAERLVITDLTDRIYISCAQAMGMHYGGAPSGPAGTGKTETTKDMGRTCGQYFITINCSDQMNVQGMGRLFKGIAASGCWCGFDEVNRVSLDVLSVVAAQIGCLFHAKREHRTEFTFTDGTAVKHNPNCAVFVTMNPGYAGRTELPENMKALFRCIAVVVPDRLAIIRVRLAAAGFQENQLLGRKFFVLYQLCEEQLSRQTHYDFGLRNVLAVLRICAVALRAAAAEEGPEAGGPDRESKVLLQVLRDMNLPKLVDDDGLLFASLLHDLFATTVVDAIRQPQLAEAVVAEVEQAGLLPHHDWLLKALQFAEQWRVRHGICIMGPSGTGKTSALRCLSGGLARLGTPIKSSRMNPKAITATLMFGRLERTTGDWTDGVFSALWRKALKRKAEEVWIELDGPVDSLWVENLNTVLDDTKVLTLANGDRLGMPPGLRLVFEVADLDNASPATVSRMGMVYMGWRTLPWQVLVDVWLRRLLTAKRRRPAEADALQGLFTRHVPRMLAYLAESATPRMALPETSRVATCLKLLDGLLTPLEGPGEAQLDTDQLGRAFCFAAMWGLGGPLDAVDRFRFGAWLQAAGLAVPRDTGGPFTYGLDAALQWVPWATLVPAYHYPRPPERAPPFHSVLIPTVDTVATEHVVHLVARQQLAVLLVGEPGTAKTVLLQQYLQHRPDDAIIKGINFSSATTALLFQGTLETFLEKVSGTSYGPPPGRRMFIFIDDLNLPEINCWGDQETNELLRQLMEEGGFYNVQKGGAEWSAVLAVQFVAAMRQPGASANDIPDRLKRHFAVFNVPVLSDQSIDHIFRHISVGHFCPERGFSAEVVEMAANLPALTRRLWAAMKGRMLPTPSKAHYVFNLRDLSRVFQGMLRGTAPIVTTTPGLLQLWKHECHRVMADKLTEEEEVAWFLAKVSALVEGTLGVALAPHVQEDIVMADFLRDSTDADGELRREDIYEPVPSFAALHERLTLFLQEYNEAYRKGHMALVLFEFAMEHLLRIYRVLKQPRGHALLIGVGGSGKQSITRLATYIAGYRAFQLAITKSYGLPNLLEDLQMLHQTAALGSPMVFLFTDNEVKEEGFLEYVNMILTAGEIPGLHSKEDLEGMLEELRPLAQEALGPEFVDTRECLAAFYGRRVRERLHLVLSFSPMGDRLRHRSRRFPGLISGCTIDWFPAWPLPALLATAQAALKDYEMNCSDRMRENLALHMCHLHHEIWKLSPSYFARYRRRVYVTPKSYLDFIATFKLLYSQKLQEMQTLKANVKVGLQRLAQAQEDVAGMRRALVDKEQHLQRAAQELGQMLEVITRQTRVAQVKTDEVQRVKDELAGQAAAIRAEKQRAESELQAAQPALEAAIHALETIKQEDISTLKKLGNPPSLVRRIMDGVLLLLGNPLNPVRAEAEPSGRLLLTPSWNHAKVMISDMRFLHNLREFDKDCVTDEQCELLLPYLDMEDFTQARAEKSCGSIAGLCTWVRAMVTYHEIAKVVAPKRARLRYAEANLRRAQAQLQTTEEELQGKRAALEEAQAKYEAALAEKQRLQDDAEGTRAKLATAQALIAGLTAEQGRWVQQSEWVDDEVRKLVGNACSAAVFLSYCGPFNQEYRGTIVDQLCRDSLGKRGLSCSPDLRLTHFLTTEHCIGRWLLEGLPRDELSIQNAVIVSQSARYPLLVDPQGQGKRWIVQKESRSCVTTLQKKSFRSDLEEALQHGLALLIEDSGEELPALLDPVIGQQFLSSLAGDGKWIRTVVVGDRDVEVHPSFTLFIATKLANPHFTPELSAKLSIVDFTVTMHGLEEQLLGLVLLAERASLEEERNGLLGEIAACRRIVGQCEQQLLGKLSETKGNLLEDTSLVDVLHNTQATAREVAEKLRSAEETEGKLDQARQDFRPIAHRGSILYFVLSELALVNPMYQTSLAQFLRLFAHSLAAAPPNAYPPRRIQNITEYLTGYVHRYVQRGLYVKHKTMFSLLLALKVDLCAGRIHQAGLRTFLKGGATVDLTQHPKRPGWVTAEEAWRNAVALQELPLFGTLLSHIQQRELEWRHWYDAECPEEEALPGSYGEQLQPFHHLLLVRALREDRVLPAAAKYIGRTLGPQFTAAVAVSFEETYEESDAGTPIVCLLSPGVDPSGEIETLAKKARCEIGCLSMGQGQEAQARALLGRAVADGGWVLLQNCHLSVGYCAELAEQLLALATAEEASAPPALNPAFRLWLTSDPTPHFPIALLQMAVKVTDEPPQGIRAGLRRCYAWVTQDQLEAVDCREWRQLLFVLCFLHSVLMERRKFGPQGWCVPYEFTHHDLVASALFLQNYLYTDSKKGISWRTVQYMVCEVQYGGRVTDDFDKRLLTTYGEAWFSEAVLHKHWRFHEGYPVPDFKAVDAYHRFIDDLPATDRLEVFGLLPVAEVAYNKKSAQDILQTILSIQPKEGAQLGHGGAEQAVGHMCADLLAKLGEGFREADIRTLVERQGPQPLTIFLRQELRRMQALLDRVQRDLTHLRLAIEGSVVMSAELQRTMDQLYDATVPEAWSRLAWGCSALGYWTEDLLRQIAQFSAWLHSGKPRCFWLPGFFNPQGFLTAIKQENSRRHTSWSLETVSIRTEVTKFAHPDALPPTTDDFTVFINGLSLDGAAWDRTNGALVEPAAKAPVNPLPVIRIAALSSLSAAADARAYPCPVYRLPARTAQHYIFDLTLKTVDVASETWILRGVAALCSVH